MLSKGGLKVGDALVLTKPLGFGVTTTALKREQADAQDVAEAVGWMKQLNKNASQLANEFELSSGTDITGYSLLGHAMEMADASGVALNFELANIPFISCARKYAEKGFFAGGAFDNKLHFESKVKFAESIDEQNQMLLFDPQTSGGLLLGVPQGKLDSFIARAGDLDQAVWMVGHVETGAGITVR
jgi:selenide,water dikinase